VIQILAFGPKIKNDSL